MRVRVFAPAKVNLTLHVGALRADGRHALESVAVFADVGDWIWAEDDDRPSLNLAGPFAAALAQERDNLAVRAARLLASEAGIARGVRLTLDKHLPIASGIGGGSADAAAVLRALDALWALNLSVRDMHRLAAQIGSDVSACVGSEPCFMTGAGDQISPLPDWPEMNAVLVNPGSVAPTGEVYRRFDEMRLARPVSAQAPAITELAQAIAYIEAGRNDLTEPAKAIAPAIADVLALLAAHAPIVRLSGSGATCFALAESAARAQKVASAVSAARPQWWVRATRLGRANVTPQRA